MQSAYTGHPIQAGLHKPRLQGEFAQFSIAGLRQCLVVDVFYTDHPQNRSKRWVEYLLRDTQTGDIYTNAVSLQSAFGVTDGEETILHPATKNVDPNNMLPFDKTTRALDSDGQQVVIGVIEGSIHRAVILGALPHRDNAYAAKKEDGERRYLTHKGTAVKIDKEGTYTITRGEAVVTVNADESVSVVRGNASLQLGTDNTLTADGVEVKLGASATNAVVKGNEFNAQMVQPLISALNVLQPILIAQATAQAPDVVLPIPTALTAVAVQTMLQALNALVTTWLTALGQFPTTLSTKVKTE